MSSIWKGVAWALGLELGLGLLVFVGFLSCSGCAVRTGGSSGGEDHVPGRGGFDGEQSSEGSAGDEGSYRPIRETDSGYREGGGLPEEDASVEMPDATPAVDGSMVAPDATVTCEPSVSCEDDQDYYADVSQLDLYTFEGRGAKSLRLYLNYANVIRWKLLEGGDHYYVEGGYFCTSGYDSHITVLPARQDVFVHVRSVLLGQECRPWKVEVSIGR